MAEDFRVNSVYFSQLPWKTSILCRPGGLDELKGVVEISVRTTHAYNLNCKKAKSLKQRFIQRIQENEQALWTETMDSEELTARGLTRPPPSHHPPESLRSLGNIFCLNGSMPPKKKDAIVKELLKYRLIDVFAHAHMRPELEGFSCSAAAVPKQDVIRAAPQLVRHIFVRTIS
jgi:hypothetical protein